MHHLQSALKLDAAQLSTAGRKPINEDSLGIRIPEGQALVTKGAVAVIADGVSSAEAGKEAAESCVTGFLGDYFSTPEPWSVKRSAQQVINALNRWLYSQGRHYPQAEKGYVSTLSIAVLKSRTVHLFHVGDSRIYRYRDGSLEQLSRDHARRINERQSYLTRAMGLDNYLEVDYRTVDMALGDVFLLSTDGLHGVLDNTALAKLLGQLDDKLDKGCAALVEAALSAGSDDNISCQLLRVAALPDENADELYGRLTALPFPPLLQAGDQLDGLRVEAEIHASSRSQIYLVSDPASGRRYAMKTPSVNFQDDPAYLERFVMESWIGKRITCAEVVAVAEPPQPASCLYYLSDYVEGATLTQWMREHPRPPPQQVVGIVQGIVRGLLSMHRRDTLHGDIKPDNIIITPDGEPRIIDFGSCFVAGLAEIVAPIDRQHRLGTAQYSAPEMVLERAINARSDQFSLAVLIFEMLTGQQPYQGRLAHCRSVGAYRRLRYIPASHYHPHVPQWLDAALEKAMNVSPELRYADVAEFVHDLQHPNPQFVSRAALPLLSRDPLRVWQGIAALLLFIVILLLLD